MGNNMKAAVLERLGQPLSIRDEIQIPELEYGQVLVELAYSGVCHSQLMEARGKRGNDRYLPHLLGHEGTGRVVSIGKGVAKVRPGDWVVLGWIKGVGINAVGARYHHHDGVINAGAVTTFNDHAIISENRIVKLPPGIPLDIGVLLGCAIPTGAGIVTNTLKPHAGSTVAVFGLGGIGLSALMALQLFECKKIIAIDISSDKLKLANEFGADLTINALEPDLVERVKAQTNGGVDYCIEAAGRIETIEQAFASLNQTGTCVFASHPPFGERISIDPFELICGKKIFGSWGGDCNPDVDIPRFAELYVAGRLPLHKLLSKQYSLDQINEAIDDLEAQRVNRPLIVINPQLAQEYALRR
jgi:S-(hydroxymethyl)glutathione dehydrogenase/alcohol dehydrogenase